MEIEQLPLVLLAVIFVISAAFVWLAGTRLAVNGDELAERLNLTREFMGLVFLATATELPEIVTTLTAAHVDNAALVLGNMFGGITMQTAILAVADIFVVRNALTSWPRKSTHALLAVILIVLLGLLLTITFAGDFVLVLNVGLGAILLTGAYPLTLILLRRYDERNSWAPIDLPEDFDRQKTIASKSNGLEKTATKWLVIQSLGCSAIILIAGVALALSADAMAEKTAIGSSFIGISLLAAATSLPELSTTIAAARIGAYTMAINNIFGSNLIMIALILPADIAYRGGAILSEANIGAQFSIATGILVTAIYVAGLLIRRTPKILGAGFDSWLVLGVYLASLYAVYHM